MSITESSSNYNDLELKSTRELLEGINSEDFLVPKAVNKAIPQIESLVEAIYQRMREGGRLFYIGAGTSGRLGVVDASECPPTFGVSFDLVNGIIAGGDSAIRKAVEFAEDDEQQAWQDLKNANIGPLDSVIGVAASGRTPYVIGGLESCKKDNILTGCITCNPASLLAKTAEYPIEVVVGAEFVTGSTRMKAGTAQKLVLNMISTALMIRLGKVKGNRMVDMQLSNEKLVDRGTKMVVEVTQLPYKEAEHLLLEEGSVRGAIEAFKNKKR